MSEELQHKGKCPEHRQIMHSMVGAWRQKMRERKQPVSFLLPFPLF